MVCAFGLPRYTPTDRPPCSASTAPSRSATTAKASSQPTSVQLPVAAHQRPGQPVRVAVEFGRSWPPWDR